ncbi:MAG: Tripartite ATP-independent periplasmic transporter [Smithella sp. PtaU1.Bin162]|nr:MAG: Tripartite ATP-independent periplasmic transporter [Smithella sp. PtaU1.Bin162]
MKFIDCIDLVSEWTGRIAAWVVIPLMLVVIYEVSMRKLFNMPSEWGYDVCWMLFGLQFMLGGAYTLLHKGHVRIDIVYNVLSPRGKLIFDAAVYIVFFLFVTILLTWAGFRFAADAWRTGENLSTTGWPFPAAPIKTVIPVAFILLFLQSLSELIRNILLLRKEKVNES